MPLRCSDTIDLVKSFLPPPSFSGRRTASSSWLPARISCDVNHTQKRAEITLRAQSKWERQNCSSAVKSDGRLGVGLQSLARLLATFFSEFLWRHRCLSNIIINAVKTATWRAPLPLPNCPFPTAIRSFFHCHRPTLFEDRAQWPRRC